MGAWLRKNGAAVYGTSASPWADHPFDGRATVKGDTLFVHVFTWPDEGVRLKGLVGTIAGAGPVDPSVGFRGAEVSEGDGPHDVLLLPPERPDPYATVIAVRFEGTPAVKEE
jgi:alpha-L-fucosidase